MKFTMSYPQSNVTREPGELERCAYSSLFTAFEFHSQQPIDDRMRGQFLFDSIVKRLGQGFGGEGQAQAGEGVPNRVDTYASSPPRSKARLPTNCECSHQPPEALVLLLKSDEIFTPFISLIRQKKPDPHQKTLDLTERV